MKKRCETCSNWNGSVPDTEMCGWGRCSVHTAPVIGYPDGGAWECEIGLVEDDGLVTYYLSYCKDWCGDENSG